MECIMKRPVVPQDTQTCETCTVEESAINLEDPVYIAAFFCLMCDAIRQFVEGQTNRCEIAFGAYPAFHSHLSALALTGL
jgi:hypothetical protein